MIKINKILLISGLFFLFSFGLAKAADFNMLPETGQLGLAKEFTVNVKIDTAGKSINAAQAAITYSHNILEIKSTSRDNSAFNFWLQEPTFSNTDGKLRFIAGTPNSISGSALQVLTITFISKAIGSADIIFTDGAITASDGTGNNIMSKANGANFTVSSSVANVSRAAPRPIAIHPSFPPPSPAAAPTAAANEFATIGNIVSLGTGNAWLAVVIALAMIFAAYSLGRMRAGRR